MIRCQEMIGNILIVCMMMKNNEGHYLTRRKRIGGLKMTREELKEQVDELMRQYDNEEIDGETYQRQMMELTSAAQDEDSDN